MRLTDWKARLAGYIAEAHARPFEAGKNDCALFAAGGVLAMTGKDYAAAFRGRYTTLRGGFRVLKKVGFADHIELAAASLPEIAPEQAKAGDLAVVPGEGGDALGIVQGAVVYVLTEEQLGFVPRALITRAFKV